MHQLMYNFVFATKQKTSGIFLGCAKQFVTRKCYNLVFTEGLTLQNKKLNGQFNSAQWQRPGLMRTTPRQRLKGAA